MKKKALLLAQVLVLVTSTFLNVGTISSQAILGMDVVINEFDSNPPIGPQWVELYNPTDFAYSISLWKITTRSVGITYTIPVGSSISGKGYFVVEFPFPIIDPVGDVIYLLDNNALQIDRTPSLAKTIIDNTAWARVPNGIDTDSTLDWKQQAATKATSNDVMITPPQPPTIVCTLSSVQIEIGSAVTITVAIGPPREASITIQTKKAEALDWNNLTTTVTDGSGRSVHEWTTDVMGGHHVRAYVYPSAAIPGMFSLPISLFVTKIRMQLSCLVTHPTIRLGQDLATYGYLIPTIEGVTITLTYRKPTGPPIVRQVQTRSDGLYNDTIFTPGQPGNWNVTASWEGDETHMMATSPLTRFYVEPPPATPFGMWLIISMVVSITVSALLLAAGLSRKIIAKPPRRVTLCPQCRTVLLYVPSLRGWYCPRCRRHFQ